MVIVFLASCEGTAHRATFQVEQDVIVRVDSAEEKKLGPGESFDLVESQTALVESPGHVALLLVPMDTEAKSGSIRLRPMEKWSSRESQIQLNNMLNDVLSEVIVVQGLIGSKKGAEALEKITDLQRRYPEVSYLNFLRVSCYIIMGDVSKAKVSLAQSLKDFPKDQLGLELQGILLRGESGADQK